MIRMNTKIYRKEDLRNEQVKAHIKSVLHQGGLVVFPTETVYGIGANALNPQAVLSIYQAKGRPSDNPLIVHIAHKKDLYQYIDDIPRVSTKLMDAYWPGPLTLIFDKSSKIPYEVTGGLNTVAIRMPNHPIALDVIGLSELPICAPSANLSGRPSSTLFEHVYEDFNGKVDIIIDGGKAKIGLESTVLDVTTPIPTLLRPGAITKAMIEKTLELGIIDGTDKKVNDIPKSPGMKYKHYAPKGQMTLVDGKIENVISYVNQIVKSLDITKTAVIGADEVTSHIDLKYKVSLGHLSNLDEIASNLFIALRQMDDLGIEHIFIHSLPESDLGQAIMNRLSKASGYNTIHV
jgi:L-threonylcarbamoyladenylate synthase